MVIANAARVIVNWNIGYLQIDRDNQGIRTAIGVNGALPIPPVYVTEGDTLVLHVYNGLNQSTSIHAHGIFQRNTNYMDGPAMVTQCGIPPGGSFTYEYQINQAGTFWLHGHDHHQNSDGLRTPLIVRDKHSPPFYYDKEYIFSLEDWYNAPFSERLADTLDPNKPFPPEPSYPHALINGYNGNHTGPLLFEVGKTYRIRLINMSTTEWFKFAMSNHQMKVIEADGVYSVPAPVDGVTLGPGQRYSILVSAHSNSNYNYKYMIELFASFIPELRGMSPRYYSGRIEYNPNALVVAVNPETTLKSLPENESMAWMYDVELSALSHRPALPVDRSIELVLGGASFTDGITRDVINNITYAQPLIPTLYSAISMGSLSTNETIYGPQSHAIILRHLEYIELTIYNPNSLPHPMHLHGHTFQIIEYGPIDIEMFPNSERNPSTASIIKASNHPMERDTIVIPIMQYVKLRFRADNPGVWLFHCHMDIHFGMGMALTFVEAPDVLQSTMNIPKNMLKMCLDQGIGISGNAAGNSGFDLNGLPTPPIMTFPGTSVRP
ncbi:hypothetical protein COEREDRAFT_94807 [Coemansia reversa NRRL 1564]|uniref:Cupredoxin n=1 Tax=Coemansia reversa (strain ATCC 12441 / NRRL 1564) TaxID=763665 RepID=A0A2G5B1V6_COERN|nr:hypothetical protein COEREDRAFT_94807 [Coemansia reversa NRRL 1564]|eukprot:PIA12998.1 hypothetical protein COEREDRAFT_94807 [Coemansia reversa NRRL 1564]